MKVSFLSLLAIISLTTQSIAENVVSWPLSLDSGKHVRAGDAVVQLPSEPNNTTPLHPVSQEGGTTLSYEASTFIDSAKNPLVVCFPDPGFGPSTYLTAESFDFVTKESQWQINFRMKFLEARPLILLSLGGSEKNSIHVSINIDGTPRITQTEMFDVTLDQIKLLPDVEYELFLTLDGNSLSLQVNDEKIIISENATPILGNGVSFGGPTNDSYGVFIGTLSSISVSKEISSR